MPRVVNPSWAAC